MKKTQKSCEGLGGALFWFLEAVLVSMNFKFMGKCNLPRNRFFKSTLNCSITNGIRAIGGIDRDNKHAFIYFYFFFWIHGKYWNLRDWAYITIWRVIIFFNDENESNVNWISLLSSYSINFKKFLWLIFGITKVSFITLNKSLWDISRLLIYVGKTIWE